MCTYHRLNWCLTQIHYNVRCCYVYNSLGKNDRAIKTDWRMINIKYHNPKTTTPHLMCSVSFLSYNTLRTLGAVFVFRMKTTRRFLIHAYISMATVDQHVCTVWRAQDGAHASTGRRKLRFYDEEVVWARSNVAFYAKLVTKSWICYWDPNSSQTNPWMGPSTRQWSSVQSFLKLEIGWVWS